MADAGRDEDTAAAGASDRAILLNVLIVAACALVYELLCGTVASYLFGNTVLEFSLVLGTYLFAMGVGSWLSKWLEPRAPRRYVEIELLLAWIGGASVPLLFLAEVAGWPVRPLLYALTSAIGVLVGLELPLLVRILRDRPGPRPFGDTVSQALAYDHLGSLCASLLFPLWLVPQLGLLRTAALTGVVNTACAASATLLVRHPRALAIRGLCAFTVLALGVWFARADAWLGQALD